MIIFLLPFEGWDEGRFYSSFHPHPDLSPRGRGVLLITQVIFLVMSSCKVAGFITVGLGFLVRVEDDQVFRTDGAGQMAIRRVVFPGLRLVLVRFRAGHELRLETVLAVDAAQSQRVRFYYLVLRFQVLYLR